MRSNDRVGRSSEGAKTEDWSVMKNQKLLLLTLLFTGQLISMDNSSPGAGGTGESVPSSAEDSRVSNADNSAGAGGSRSLQLTQKVFNRLNNFGHYTLLENILEQTGLSPETRLKVSQVAKSWNKVVGDLSKRNYKYLMSLENPRIARLLHLPEDAMSRYKGYKSFVDFYQKLARQADRPRPTTRPDEDITNPQLFLKMTQEVQDTNLVKAWRGMREAMVEATPAAAASMPAEVSTPEDIRAWLHAEENQAAIQQVTELNLSWLELTCLPEEASLFTALQRLHLSDNQLTEVNIPATLTALQQLYLARNRLTKVNIPDTLTALQRLYLQNNQLREVNIPDTLTALRELYLGDNQLTEVNIPATLTALQWLNLVRNRLTKVNIPDTLTVLRQLYLGNNQLTKVNIPDTLTDLQTLCLKDNQLTPESITIPEAIRDRALCISGETEQRPVTD